MSFDTQSNLVEGSGFLLISWEPQKAGLTTNSCESCVKKAAFRRCAHQINSYPGAKRKTGNSE